MKIFVFYQHKIFSVSQELQIQTMHNFYLTRMPFSHATHYIIVWHVRHETTDWSIKFVSNIHFYKLTI